MAENISTPRISAPHLENFSHQTVRVLGKVTQLRGEQATLDAGGDVHVLLNRGPVQDSHLILNHAFEIVGKVNADLSVKVLAATDFGANLDYSAVAAVVEATHRYKEIFYESGDI
ncbi:MAG: hypothetical protein M1832_004283 [Thelocarpon impressellum]|nr:MAG: hypothetical protein M1832_004283 [Thelocarpon impressellum]